MEGRMAVFDAHFDLDNSEDDSAPMTAPAAYLAAEGADPAEQVEAEDWEDATVGALQNALAGLMIEADIIQSRWLAEDKATLHTLADRCDVSAERIRQLELAALKSSRARSPPKVRDWLLVSAGSSAPPGWPLARSGPTACASGLASRSGKRPCSTI